MRLKKIANKKSIGLVLSDIHDIVNAMESIKNNLDSFCENLSEKDCQQFKGAINSIEDELEIVYDTASKLDEAYSEKRMEYDK